MPLWLDMLRTPMAAPETRTLRRWRRVWQLLCVATAAMIMLVSPLSRVLGRLAPLAAGILLLATIVCTWAYVTRKQRADTAFLDAGGAGARDEELA